MLIAILSNDSVMVNDLRTFWGHHDVEVELLHETVYVLQMIEQKQPAIIYYDMATARRSPEDYLDEFADMPSINHIPVLLIDEEDDPGWTWICSMSGGKMWYLAKPLDYNILKAFTEKLIEINPNPFL